MKNNYINCAFSFCPIMHHILTLFLFLTFHFNPLYLVYIWFFYHYIRYHGYESVWWLSIILPIGGAYLAYTSYQGVYIVLIFKYVYMYSQYMYIYLSVYMYSYMFKVVIYKCSMLTRCEPGRECKKEIIP